MSIAVSASVPVDSSFSFIPTQPGILEAKVSLAFIPERAIQKWISSLGVIAHAIEDGRAPRRLLAEAIGAQLSRSGETEWYNFQELWAYFATRETPLSRSVFIPFVPKNDLFLVPNETKTEDEYDFISPKSLLIYDRASKTISIRLTYNEHLLTEANREIIEQELQEVCDSLLQQSRPAPAFTQLIEGDASSEEKVLCDQIKAHLKALGASALADRIKKVDARLQHTLIAKALESASWIDLYEHGNPEVLAAIFKGPRGSVVDLQRLLYWINRRVFPHLDPALTQLEDREEIWVRHEAIRNWLKEEGNHKKIELVLRGLYQKRDPKLEPTHFRAGKEVKGFRADLIEGLARLLSGEESTLTDNELKDFVPWLKPYVYFSDLVRWQHKGLPGAAKLLQGLEVALGLEDDQRDQFTLDREDVKKLKMYRKYKGPLFSSAVWYLRKGSQETIAKLAASMRHHNQLVSAEEWHQLENTRGQLNDTNFDRTVSRIAAIHPNQFAHRLKDKFGETWMKAHLPRTVQNMVPKGRAVLTKRV